MLNKSPSFSALAFGCHFPPVFGQAFINACPKTGGKWRQNPLRKTAAI